MFDPAAHAGPRVIYLLLYVLYEKYNVGELDSNYSIQRVHITKLNFESMDPTVLGSVFTVSSSISAMKENSRKASGAGGRLGHTFFSPSSCLCTVLRAKEPKHSPPSIATILHIGTTCSSRLSQDYYYGPVPVVSVVVATSTDPKADKKQQQRRQQQPPRHGRRGV